MAKQHERVHVVGSDYRILINDGLADNMTVHSPDMQGEILDLSVGGCCIRTSLKVKPQVGSEYLIRLIHPDISTKVILCKIAWIAVEGETYRIGIQFITIHSTDLERLTSYIEKLIREKR
jgi:c-di-GMP-binding flagellar brake protein YcgR